MDTPCMSPAWTEQIARARARTHEHLEGEMYVSRVCVCVPTCVSCIIQVVRDLEPQRGVLHTYIAPGSHQLCHQVMHAA